MLELGRRLIMKKIVFLDLDDTLWRFEQIPDSALEAIELARKNGNKIFVNTGRTRCEVPQLLWDLHLDGYCFSSGSEIYVEGKRVLYVPLDKDLIKFTQKNADLYNIAFSLEGSEMTFSNEKHRQRKASFMVDNRMGNRFLTFPDMHTMKEEDYDQIMKFNMHFDDMQQKEDFLKTLPKEFVFTDSKHLGGEITYKQYNKATAIHYAEEYYDYAYETVAIGDSGNDLAMLYYADIAVAMGNGVSDVKNMADFVTDAIDHDGLYKAFRRLHLF